MKYETPEVTELAPAIDAIQSGKSGGQNETHTDASVAYEDWE